MENSKLGFVKSSTKMRRMRILRLLKHCEYDTIPQNGLKLTIKSHYVLEIGQPCLQQKSHFALKQQFYWTTYYRNQRRSAPPTADRNSTGNVQCSSQHRWLGLPPSLLLHARLRLVTFGVKSVGCRLSSLANLRPLYFSKTSRHVCLTKCVNFLKNLSDIY